MLRLFKNDVPKPAHSKGKHKSSNSVTSEGNGVIERQAEIGAERELYAYDKPTQTLGIGDLIKSHEPGTRFLYAALTGKESEDIDSRLRKLVNYKPRLNKKAISIDKLPTIELFRETEVYPLTNLLNYKNVGSYVRISDAICLYGAIVSPDCNFTKIRIGIIDNRLLDNKSVKSFIATTNLPAVGNLKLPYCVPKRDCDKLSLTVSRERAFIEEGLQWGALQLQIMIESYDFPVQFENTEVTAVNKLPKTLLEDRATDPDHIDISITNNDRMNLTELFLSGDIADENEPIENKTEAVKYAKSSLNQPIGRKYTAPSKDWEFMSQKRIGMVNADQQSADPDDTSQHSVRLPTPPMSHIHNLRKKVAFSEPDQESDKVTKTSKLTPWS